nr:hypothetical protein GTC16762_07890 [Pigmentibacter ruber]
MPINSLILRKQYFPKQSENRMTFNGDLVAARNYFIKTRFKNLDFLLKSRYEWMNPYLANKEKIVEIGCGAGFSHLYLNNKPILTDALENPWVDKLIDATNMDFEDTSIDVIIASHTIHHFYSPYKFFEECQRVLKKDGVILIQDVNSSLFMRFILRIMRHEGWSYQVNIFDPQTIANDPADVWSANCAIPELLFQDKVKFQNCFHNLSIEKYNKCEFLIFPLSGGVNAKIRMPEFSNSILKFISFIDKMLVKIAPNIFALGCSVVVRKFK